MAFFGVPPPFHARKAYLMQINSFVYVMHPENGGVRLSPGEVPEWAEPLITNKALIVQATPEPPKPEQAKPGTDSKGEDDEGGPGVDPDPEAVPVPPKGGRGGSAEAWAKYAASKGFEVEGTAKASEIREALEAEGIPTE